jgi:hypothetical protein
MVSRARKKERKKTYLGLETHLRLKPLLLLPFLLLPVVVVVPLLLLPVFVELWW